MPPTNPQVKHIIVVRRMTSKWVHTCKAKQKMTNGHKDFIKSIVLNRKGKPTWDQMTLIMQTCAYTCFHKCSKG